MADSFRVPTRPEQEIIATVVRMVDSLRVHNFEPSCVILNDDTWGSSGDHFLSILGLPVIHRPDNKWPSIQVGVIAP
jgi:hypothetical protein